jgi:hypothetical protein
MNMKSSFLLSLCTVFLICSNIVSADFIIWADSTSDTIVRADLDGSNQMNPYP